MSNNTMQLVYGVFAPNKNGLMPHNDRYPLFSRDWIDIDCNAIRCIYIIKTKNVQYQV